MATEQEARVVDALRLVPAYGREVVVDTARETHRAWSSRTFHVLNRLTRNRARGAQRLHDGISTAAYGSLGLGLTAADRALHTAGAAGLGPRLDDGPRGRFVRSALNGVVGDRLAHDRSRLAIPMAVRHRGVDVPPEPAELAEAFGEATGKVAVFLHGLAENDGHFDLHRDQVGSTYPDLVRSMGWTPVMVRANTGLPLRTNGVELAALLRDLVAAWPQPVTRIALVGHSMGGLVARAACSVLAAENGAGSHQAWTRLLTDVVTLGTPHRGAPMAAWVGHGSRLLGRLPETSAFAKVLDHRSGGIADLVDGLGEEVPALPRVRYRLVAATLTGTHRHPVGRFLGDLLVRVPSAHGRRRGIELFHGADVVHVPGTDHFGLLNHPDVHARMRRWLA